MCSYVCICVYVYSETLVVTAVLKIADPLGQQCPTCMTGPLVPASYRSLDTSIPYLVLYYRPIQEILQLLLSYPSIDTDHATFTTWAI